ncbi:MAG: glutamine synthetase, partial [Proteobacteria bacterium]|nr:glutamine synthetase [Pseudomonadota bacterium]
MHLHQSIINKKTSKNIFISKNGKPNSLFKSYIAGLQKYTPATMSIFAPNVNSYRRIARYYAAPINTHWGFDNRT